VREVLDAS